MTIHSARQAYLALLLAKKVSVLAKYVDFADMFSEKLANVLPERTGVNKHVMEFEKGKQPLYGSIYSLGLVELKSLKTYIETNLANGFIRSSKLPAGAPILFIRKTNGSFYLCINYQELNNLIIKNRYPLPLISKSLNWLGQAKLFTHLDLISAYHWIKIKKSNKWKTAFWTWYGHFKYQIIPFRLSNAPANF